MEDSESLQIRELLVSILEMAFRDATAVLSDRKMGYLSTPQTTKRQAIQWISDLEDINSPSPFSYCWICTALGLDPEVLKDKVLVEGTKIKKTRAKYRAVNKSFNDDIEPDIIDSITISRRKTITH